ncbi:glycosyl hydrolase [Streptomyces fenghuangensis]
MPDYRLDGLTPADQAAADAKERLDLAGDDFRVLVGHHTADAAHSFLVLHDSSATWGLPGAPQLVSLHIARDLQAGTFRIEEAQHAMLPFAQRWLVARGCDPAAIRLPEGRYSRPADALTTEIEERIVRSGGRYEVLDHHTRDGEPHETWVMVRDTDPGAAQRPVRLFLEEADLDAFTYTVREGAFRDGTSANQWLIDRDTPLPETVRHPGAPDLRARAALSRSSGTGTHPTADAARVAPASEPQQRHDRRRAR